MLNHTIQHQPIYKAEAAYFLREFVKTKRYQLSEITATTVNIGDPARAEVEAFIHAVFKNAYEADVTLFMPHLVALRDSNGILMAAFGLRPASEGPLFLEQYLDTLIGTHRKGTQQVCKHEITTGMLT